MTDLHASANGVPITSASVEVPWYGAPTAEITLANDATLTSPVTLTIGNLTLTMAILRQASFSGVTQALLVGGAARWSAVVSVGPYENPAGVMLSTVLGDIATATRSSPGNASTGERVIVAADRSLGVLYVPERAPASRLLSVLAGELWWIDTTGTTQVGPRALTTVRTDASIEWRRGAQGVLDVASEDPASWLPGARYSGPTVPDTITVASSRFVVTESKLRIVVMTLDALAAADTGAPSAQDRTAAALRAFIRGEDTRRGYHGLYEYTVVEADGSTFAGLPVDAEVAPTLPRRVPYRPSLAGSTCIPKPGALAIVGFVDGKPARPFVVAFDGTVPTSTTIDASKLETSTGTIQGVVHVGEHSDSVIIANATAVTTSATDAATERRVVCYGDTVSVGVATGPLTLVGAACSKVRA